MVVGDKALDIADHAEHSSDLRLFRNGFWILHALINIRHTDSFDLQG
jgi:hypothetical protein